MKNLAKKIIFFAFLFIFPCALALCQSAENPVNWQVSLKWEKVPLSEVPLIDTRIEILGGYVNASFLFSKSDFSEEIVLNAEGNIENGSVHLAQWDKNIDKVNGDFTIKNKNLKIGPLTGEINNNRVEINANVDITSPYSFDASLKAKGVILEEISTFLPFLEDYKMFRAPAQAQFDINGVLPDGPIEIAAIFQEAVLYSVLMQNVKISFIWQDNQVILKNFTADLEEGKISGEGEIILKKK